MSKNNSQYELARNNEMIRKRLYKSKHGWNVAAMGALTLGAGVIGTMSVEHVANADVVAPTQQATTAQTAVATATPAETQTPAEGSSVIQGPTTPTNVTAITPEVNSANTAVAGAFSSQHNAIEDAGGTLNQSSTARITVSDSNASSAGSFVKSDAQSQLNNISVTASADAKIGSAVKSDVALGQKVGAKVSAGSALDVSSMSDDAIAKLGSQQVGRLSAVGSANGLLSDEVAMNSGLIASAGGTLVPGSAVNTDSMTPDEIAESVASMASMLSVTGSAASTITSASQHFVSDINAAGGQLKKSDAINTADNMTVSDVQSTVKSQVDRISATASGDAEIKSIYDADSANIVSAGGKLAMGSEIDVSKLTPAQIGQIVAGQSAMLSATVKGNTEVGSAVSANNDAVNKVGGKLTSNGVINTADNMTPDQVLADAKTTTDRVNATGSADVVVASAVSNAKVNGAKVVLGSATDATNMTPSQIKSMVAAQSAMISATVAAHGEVTTAANSNAPLAKQVGGVITQSGEVNTADNMTVDQVAKSAKAQTDRINATGSADVVVSGALSNASANKTKVVLGSATDTTNMTPDQIKSMVAGQSAMISATVKAHVDTQSAASVNVPLASQVGGKIVQSGEINTADNMTVDQVAKAEKDQTDLMNATGSADVVVSGALSAASAAKTKVVLGSETDTTSMKPADIKSMVAAQSAMISATIQAQTGVQSTVAKNSADITKVGGFIKQSGVVNTADNMTVDQVAKEAKTDEDRVNATGSADVIVNHALSAASQAGVKVVLGSTIDVSSMQPKEIQSLVDAQSAMIRATIKADQDVLKAVSDANSAITGIGGHINHVGTINTADNMTVSGVQSNAKSQADHISWTAKGDTEIASAVKAASGVIASVSGALKAGSGEINVTSMTSAEIQSVVDYQSAMLSATASADVTLNSAVKVASGAITGAGATIKESGLINTADNMTVSDIARSIKEQAGLISAVAAGDMSITKEQNAASGLSKPFGGQIKTGSALDVTGKTIDEVNALAQSEVVHMSTVASGNVALSDTQIKASDVVNAVGGQIKPGSNLDTTNMSPESLKALIASEVSQLSAVGDGDRQIGSALTNNMNSIENAGAKILSAGAIDMSKETAANIEINAKSQASNIVATGQGDYKVSQAVISTAPVINGFGGHVIKNEPSDVSSLAGSQIKSLTDSKAANLSGAASGTKVLSDGFKLAKPAIEAFGGTVTKGSNVDVSNMTPAQIDSMVKSEVAIISATASGDVKLSQALASALQAVTKIGGSIDRAGDIDTISMSVDQITSAVQKQVQNMTNVNSADIKIGNAMDRAKAPMATVGGKIMIGTAVNAESMTAAQMDSLAQSEVVRISNVTSADLGLSSAIAANSSAINGLKGGSITSAAAFDATTMGYDQINSLMVSQANNISDVAFAQNVLSDGVKTNASAASLGAAQDFTGQKKDQISSFVASQVVALGRAKDADRVADSYARDMSGFKISVNTSEVVASTAEEISSVANANTVAESTAIDHAMKNGSASVTLLKVKYVYHPLSVKYQAFDMKNTPLKTAHHVLVNHGTITPMNDHYTPYSTSFHALSDLGGYHPLDFTTTPLSVTYKGYESDGSKISVYSKDGKLNPNFTGYAPLSVNYQDFESDGSKVKPGDKFTGMTSFSTTYREFESDGAHVKKGDKFTGMTPFGMTYQDFVSDASKVKSGDKFTGMTPFSTTYQDFVSDGSKVKTGDKFTGMTPFSTKYQMFESDGKAVPSDHKFTGLAPLSTVYQGYSSDASKVKLGDKFTGFAPFNVSYKPLSTQYHFYQDVKAPEKEKKQETPKVPVANSATPAPAVAATVAPAPLVQPTRLAQSAPSQPAQPAPAHQLPQTGNEKNSWAALLGLALLTSTMGMSLLAKKRVED